MENVLARKLENFASLSPDDRRVLDEIVASGRTLPARSDLIREGQTSEKVRLLLQGFGCRYKLLKNGKRQIVGFILPGDFCNLDVSIYEPIDYNICTISSSNVVELNRQSVIDLADRPQIARAFCWVKLVEEGILREWLLNMGQRHAVERIGHLLCELYARLRIVGFADVGGFELPLTQADLGDTVGLSFVHVNRCLQTLREKKLVTVKGGTVYFHDLDGLMQYTGFNPDYLHLTSKKVLRETTTTSPAV